jgi:hypothetical protein
VASLPLSGVHCVAQSAAQQSCIANACSGTCGQLDSSGFLLLQHLPDSNMRVQWKVPRHSALVIQVAHGESSGRPVCTRT